MYETKENPSYSYLKENCLYFQNPFNSKRNTNPVLCMSVKGFVSKQRHDQTRSSSQVIGCQDTDYSNARIGCYVKDILVKLSILVYSESASIITFKRKLKFSSLIASFALAHMVTHWLKPPFHLSDSSRVSEANEVPISSHRQTYLQLPR